MHIQALVPADGILPGSSSKLRLLVINLASVTGGQLVNSPTAQSLGRCTQFCKHSKFLKMKLKTKISIVAMATTMLFFFSCRKNEQSKSLQEKVNIELERFFNVPNNASERTKKIIEKIKQDDAKHNFVKSLVENYGYPKWDKLVETNANSNGSRTTNTDTAYTLIPFQNTNSIITSFLAIADITGSLKFKLLTKQNIVGFINSSDSIAIKKNIQNAKILAAFEKSINGKDSLLLNNCKLPKVKNCSFTFTNNILGRSTNSYVITITTCGLEWVPANGWLTGLAPGQSGSYGDYVMKCSSSSIWVQTLNNDLNGGGSSNNDPNWWNPNGGGGGGGPIQVDEIDDDYDNETGDISSLTGIPVQGWTNSQNSAGHYLDQNGNTIDNTFDAQNSIILLWKGTGTGKIGSEPNGSTGNTRKSNFGEIASDVALQIKGYTALDTRRTDINQTISKGIDGVFQKGGSYYIVEGKFGSSQISGGTNPPQMSDAWINGKLQGHNQTRLEEAVGSVSLAQTINNIGYTRLLANVDANGNVIYTKLDSNGNKISGTAGEFNP